MENGTDFAATFNLCEGILWLGIAGVIAWRHWRSPPHPGICRLLPPAFIVFGISDFIETRTGSFWNPWWLLVMKVSCGMVFCIVCIAYRRAQGHEARR